MKVKIDKIASATKNIPLPPVVEVSKSVEAREGSIVVVKALGENPVYGSIELLSGRLSKVIEGDIIAGVLGERKALKGFYGTIPEKVEAGDTLHILNLGGVMGKAISGNPELGKPIEVEVLGQVQVFPDMESRIGVPANIKDRAIKWLPRLEKSVPIIVFSAANMDSGKTTAACELIKGLTAKGYKVGAAKLTGVSLMRDTLNMLDYGAVKALSFNDAGMVSTTSAPDNISEMAKGLIDELNKSEIDCIVIELGDGILGGYGVKKILEDRELMSHAKAHVFCAQDFLSVWGAKEIFNKLGLSIDVVSGKVTDNALGVEFIEKEFNIGAANAIKQPQKLVEIISKKVFGK